MKPVPKGLMIELDVEVYGVDPKVQAKGVAELLRGLANEIEYHQSVNYTVGGDELHSNVPGLGGEVVGKVFGRYASRVAAGELAWSDSLDGPWTPATLDEVARMVESRLSRGRDGMPAADPSAYADYSNGVVTYVEKGGVPYAVGDETAVHGEDALHYFQIFDGDLDVVGDGVFGDDLPELLSRI